MQNNNRLFVDKRLPGKKLCPKRTSMILLGLVLLVSVAAAGVYSWAERKNMLFDKGQRAAKSENSITKEINKDFKKVEIESIEKKEPEEKGPAVAAASISADEKATPPKEEVSSPAVAIPPKPFTFAVIADADRADDPGYNPELLTMVSRMKTYNPGIVFLTSDMVSLAKAEKLETKINAIKSSLEGSFSKTHYVFGRRDDSECDAACLEMWQQKFFNQSSQPGESPRFYKSFDYENTHFVLLASDYPSKHAIDDAQLEWLKQDLANTKQPNKIVFVQIPSVNFFADSAKSCHDMSCEPVQQQKLNSILQEGKVDLVVSGHEHAFDHKIVGGIDYVLAGNTGNPVLFKGVIKKDIFTLVSVDGEKINLKALDVNGQTVREIVVK